MTGTGEKPETSCIISVFRCHAALIYVTLSVSRFNERVPAVISIRHHQFVESSPSFL